MTDTQKMYLKAAGLVLIGILIGNCFSRGGWHRGGWERYNRSSNMHQMPDGTMMKDDGTSMHSMMDGMMMGLEGKTGDAFDQAFLSEMVVHHEGAVDMAKAVLATSKRPELIKLANEIIAAQTKEITQMKSWNTTWFTNK